MIFDTKRQTVHFDEPVTLTLAALESMASILRMLSPETENVPEPPDVTVVGYRYVLSENTKGVRYTVVKLSNGRYVCSCPDFGHRRVQHDDENCKHIHKIAYYAPIL